MKISKQRLKEIIKEELSSILNEASQRTWSVWVETPHEGAISYDIFGELTQEAVAEELKAANRHFPPGVDLIAVVDDQSKELVQTGPEFSKEEALAAIKGDSTKQRLEEIIKEELKAARLDPDLKLTDDQAPFVLRRSGAGGDKEFFRILKRKGRTLIPAWSPLENAHKYKTADAAMDGKSRVLQHGHIPVTIVPIADVLTELEEARETAAQRTKRERAESRRKTQEKKADPRVQAVDRASQAHIAKEKEKREKREKKAKEEK